MLTLRASNAITCTNLIIQSVRHSANLGGYELNDHLLRWVLTTMLERHAYDALHSAVSE